MVSNDLTGLIREGEVPDYALEEAWLSIYSEYCTLIGDIQTVALIQRTRSIHALSSKIDRIKTLVECGRQVVSDDLAAALRADGFKLDTSADDAAYLQELDVIIAKLRPDIMKLDSLMKEMPKADPKNQATEHHFTTTLIQIRKHQDNHKIQIKDLTVGEWCEYVRELREHIKQAQHHGRRAGK